MKRQNILVMLGTAAVTAALTVMLLAPRGVGAAVPKIKAVIAQPHFTSQGCVFALKTDKAEYGAGDCPVVEVKASNPSDKSVEATVWINISASAPMSPLSRMLPVPQMLWSQRCVVSLKPGETKTLKVTSEAKLPAGQNISFTISDKERAVLADNLDVKDPKRASQVSHAAQTAAARP
jgi:hypothetical protein